jgi:hypothetical protein
MDLGVCLTDAFFVDGPQYDFPGMLELGRERVPFQFHEYKSHIAWCLEQEFGRNTVKIGKKAIHIHKDDKDKIHADVVPTYTFQIFGPRLGLGSARGAPHNGIALITAEGGRITNFPDQHYLNGCAKNDRTGRRYKRVARILKRLRNHMAEHPEAPENVRVRAKNTPSFLVESLVYNCPDHLFGHTEIYDDVTAILRHLSTVLNAPLDGRTLLALPLSAFWYEVNGIKSLFGEGQAWSPSEASDFIECARAYMGV